MRMFLRIKRTTHIITSFPTLKYKNLFASATYVKYFRKYRSEHIKNIQQPQRPVKRIE